MKLIWTFETDTSVRFTLKIKDAWENNIQWYGFSIRDEGLDWDFLFYIDPIVWSILTSEPVLDLLSSALDYLPDTTSDLSVSYNENDGCGYWEVGLLVNDSDHFQKGKQYVSSIAMGDKTFSADTFAEHAASFAITLLEDFNKELSEDFVCDQEADDDSALCLTSALSFLALLFF